MLWIQTMYHGLTLLAVSSYGFPRLDSVPFEKLPAWHSVGYSEFIIRYFFSVFTIVPHGLVCRYLLLRLLIWNLFLRKCYVSLVIIYYMHLEVPFRFVRGDRSLLWDWSLTTLSGSPAQALERFEGHPFGGKSPSSRLSCFAEFSALHEINQSGQDIILQDHDLVQKQAVGHSMGMYGISRKLAIRLQLELLSTKLA